MDVWNIGPNGYKALTQLGWACKPRTLSLAATTRFEYAIGSVIVHDLVDIVGVPGSAIALQIFFAWVTNCRANVRTRIVY